MAVPVLSVGCPWCGAAPGSRCTLGRHSLSEMRDYHDSRKQLAAGTAPRT
jgi:hypothetical protein